MSIRHLREYQVDRSVSMEFREVHAGDINLKTLLMNGVWSHETGKDKSPMKQGVSCKRWHPGAK